MPKQTLVTVRNLNLDNHSACLTIVSEGQPERFRVVSNDRVRMFLQNFSATEAACGFEVTVRDFRKF